MSYGPASWWPREFTPDGSSSFSSWWYSQGCSLLLKPQKCTDERPYRDPDTIKGQLKQSRDCHNSACARAERRRAKNSQLCPGRTGTIKGGHYLGPQWGQLRSKSFHLSRKEWVRTQIRNMCQHCWYQLDGRHCPECMRFKEIEHGAAEGEVPSVAEDDSLGRDGSSTCTLETLTSESSG